MKISIITEVDAQETNTYGGHAYLVALRCGGLMEDPEIHYADYQIIHADSADEAVQKYDEINNCCFYYGKVLKIIY